MSTEPTRRVFAMMAFAEATGVATTCVGVFGIESNGTRWRTHVEWADEIAIQSGGGWLERFHAIGDITPEVVQHWLEGANGISWDLIEIEPWEFEGQTSLTSATDAVLEDVLANPDPPQSELDARRPVT